MPLLTIVILFIKNVMDFLKNITRKHLLYVTWLATYNINYLPRW